jgi:8-oxo-dGTP pyrophosphatase MutT (NUDIX family)
VSDSRTAIVEVMADAEAAVAIVHALDSDSVLLIRRAEREGDSWSGQWSCPGGRRDPGDVDLLHTALRELEEECGVSLRRADLFKALPERFARRRVGRFLSVAPFVFRVERNLAIIPDPLEAAHAEWIPLDWLRDLDRHHLREVPGIPTDTLFPAIDLECAPLWGFTYRLLCDWLGLTTTIDPAEAVARFVEQRGLSGDAVLAINRLELRPDEIRCLGPQFEEHVYSRPA